MKIVLDIWLLVAIVLSVIGLLPFFLAYLEDSKSSGYLQGFITLLGFGVSSLLILMVWLIYFIIH